MTDPLELLAGALEGRYVIEREIGSGGTAVVFRARDLRHERLVAIKVLRPELARSLGNDRFLREIRIAASLTHPHILRCTTAERPPSFSTMSCRTSRASHSGAA